VKKHWPHHSRAKRDSVLFWAQPHVVQTDSIADRKNNFFPGEIYNIIKLHPTNNTESERDIISDSLSLIIIRSS
jgi:hypothetical protein